MTETAGLTVLIDGDITGLTEAVNKAQEKIDSLSAYTSVGYGGGDFTIAKRHYTDWEDSGARSIDEKLKWWQSAMEIFYYDLDAVWEARKNIYQISREGAKEINEIFRYYAEDNNYFSSISPDSSEVYDAFDEIRQINKKFASDGIITWREYNKNISSIGEELYDGRIENSLNWLEHEEKHNNLSVDQYVEGLRRMENYTEQYYANGIIDYEKYLKAMEYLADEIKEKYTEEYFSWKNDAAAWKSDRDLFNDWEEEGDSTLDFYDRINQKISEFYQSGKISRDTMNEEMTEAYRNLYKIQSAGDEVFSKWENNAENWLRMRETYGDWEEYGDSLVSFYSRCIDRISEMYGEGHITWQKYMDDTMEYEMKLFSAESDALDSVFSEMSSYINNLQKQYAEEEKSLKSSWEVSDRSERLSELDGLLEIYRNSVTEKGKDTYKSLLDEHKALTREEQLYNLQQENNSTISKLQWQYENAEKNKGKILDEINSSNTDISDIAENIGIKFSLFGSTTENLIQQLIEEVRNAGKRISAASNSYTDNRTIKIATGVNENAVWAILNNGATVSGLGTVMYGGTTYTPTGG